MSSLTTNPIYPNVEHVKSELIPLLRDETFFVSWPRKEGRNPTRFEVPKPALDLFNDIWLWFVEQAGDNNSLLRATLMRTFANQVPRTGTDIHQDAWTTHKKLVNFSDKDSDSGTLTFPDHSQDNQVRYSADLLTREKQGQLLRTTELNINDFSVKPKEPPYGDSLVT